jgi:hypothetical protein
MASLEQRSWSWPGAGKTAGDRHRDKQRRSRERNCKVPDRGIVKWRLHPRGDAIAESEPDLHQRCLDQDGRSN